MRWPQRKPTCAEIHWVSGLFEGDGSFGGDQLQIHQKDPEVLYQVRRLLSERRQAQARRFLRISRVEDQPILDPSDPARLLWDWTPDEEAG